MGRELVNSIVAIATAIIGVAIVATLVSRNAQTGQVISSATSGFAKDLQTALSPVTGGGSSGSLVSDLSFTGGGALYNV